MLNQLKKTYIECDLGAFNKALFYLSAIEGIANEDIERLERIVKLEGHKDKLKTLATAYLEDSSLLNKMYIDYELKHLNVPKTTFLLLVDELKTPCARISQNVR